MLSSYDALLTIRRTSKFYDLFLDHLREKYQLTRIEIIIISFLFNNPDHDSVGEIAEMRMLSKGNVSRGAEALIQQGILERIPDQLDRRWAHLRLTKAAGPIVQDIEKANEEFGKLLFEGFTAKEMESFMDFNRRLVENVSRNMEGSALENADQE